MPLVASDRSLELLQRLAFPLGSAEGNYEPLIKMIGNARFVLLGEATHGTHEFYKARAEITKRLVNEKGFTVIAWEADWPDASRVNRYIRGKEGDADSNEALKDFKRFPAWMWRNADVLDFVGWLREFNSKLKTSKVGVYGLDLYSLHSSMEAVISYLDKVDPQEARAARERYSCFESFGEDAQHYGMVAAAHHSMSCENEVVQQLVELQRHAAEYLQRDGRIAADELFYAEQNAIIAKEAENYYRAMYRGRLDTWNLRDSHMVETLENLMSHLKKQGEHPKAVIWAHNSHLGDARATQMSARGEWNIGQLLRERHQSETVSIGFTTYGGTVTAASDWGAVAERKTVRPAMEESYESLFHETGIDKFFLNIREHQASIQPLKREKLERAIGVIYRPGTERWSHYFNADISRQFDAIIHFDQTRAVEPLERTSRWDKGEEPETYPSGY